MALLSNNLSLQPECVLKPINAYIYLFYYLRLN